MTTGRRERREWAVSPETLQAKPWDETRNFRAFKAVEIRPGERVFTREEINQIMLDDYDYKSADRHLDKIFGSEGEL